MMVIEKLLVRDPLKLDPRNAILKEIVNVSSSRFSSVHITDPAPIRVAKQLCKIQIGEGHWTELITTDAFARYEKTSANTIRLSKFKSYDLQLTLTNRGMEILQDFKFDGPRKMTPCEKRCMMDYGIEIWDGVTRKRKEDGTPYGAFQVS